jgi:hypothetical protein
MGRRMRIDDSTNALTIRGAESYNLRPASARTRQRSDSPPLFAFAVERSTKNTRRLGKAREE